MRRDHGEGMDKSPERWPWRPSASSRRPAGRRRCPPRRRRTHAARRPPHGRGMLGGRPSDKPAREAAAADSATPCTPPSASPATGRWREARAKGPN